jgi:hypothetical protein
MTELGSFCKVRDRETWLGRGRVKERKREEKENEKDEEISENNHRVEKKRRIQKLTNSETH